MATSRYINTNFWHDNYVIDLDPSEKLLFLYFLTNPNTTIAGIYEINIRQIAFDTGFDKDMVQKIIDRFVRDGKMWYQSGYIVLKNFVRHQRINPSVRQGINREISRLPEWLKDQIVVTETEVGLTLTVDSLSESVDSLSQGVPTLPILNLTKPIPNLDSTLPNAFVSKPTTRPVPIKTQTIQTMLDYWQSVVGMEVDTPGNRRAIAALLRQKSVGEDGLRKLVDGVALAMEDKYAPRISDFVSLKRKMNDLLVWGRKRNLEDGRVVSV